jgi:glycosyltransferase involved in cell wall biosynthesis
MRILHIWDQAGVACILAREHRRRGHEVRILKRAGYDPFKISQFYREPLLDMDGKAFLKLAVREAGNYDLIHVHSLYKVVPDLRKKHRDTKVVLHYHGSEIRGRQGDPLKEEAESKSDAILGSTTDLKDHVSSDITHLPNPVDTEHFRSDGNNVGNGAFTIRTTRGDSQWVLDYLRRNGVDLQVDIVDRENNPIPYSQVPTFLKQYGVYVDIKYIDRTLLAAPSKTGLESLSCGLRVLNHELKYVKGLPEEHRPEVVARKALDVYSSIA